MIQLLSTASLSKSLFSCIIQFLGSTLAIRVFVSMKPVWRCTQNSTFPSKNVCWFEALVDPNMCDRNVEQVKSACLHYPLLPSHPKKSHGAFSASSTSSILVVLRCGVQGNVWIPKPRWFVKFNTLMRPCSEGKHHFQQIPPSDFVFWVSLPPSKGFTLSTKMWCKWVKSWYLCPYFIIHHSILAHLIWWFF